MSLKQYTKPVACLSPRAPVIEACRAMKDKNIGAIVVVSDDNKPIGIVSDRDIVVRVLGEGRSPDKTTVEEVMTRGVVALDESTSIEEATARMGDRGVRRLPIVDKAGQVVGLVSFDDIFLLLGMELGNLATMIFKSFAAKATTVEKRPTR